MSKRAKLVIGTAQIGMPYGAANLTGIPEEGQAVSLLHAAVEGGVDTFDTARAYGESERRIGLALENASGITVVTKLDPLASISADAAPSLIDAAVTASLSGSRFALQRPRLDIVLLHRASHRTMWAGAAWHRLRAERDANSIARIGVSVQFPQEALDALAEADVSQLQLPFNILDHRWDHPELHEAIRSRPDVTIHVRSIYLQGLLAGATTRRWPRVARVDACAVLKWLVDLQGRFNRASLADLCIAFARAQDWIDGIVIGAETIAQLRENLSLFQNPPLQSHEVAIARATRPLLPESFLDPAQWPNQRV